MRTLLGPALGAVGLGIGVLCVGGNSPWLLAFVLPLWVLGYVIAFAMPV